MNVTINGDDHEDGGVERAQTNLLDGNNVIIENLYCERDKERFDELASGFSANIAFSPDCTVCQIILPK